MLYCYIDSNKLKLLNLKKSMLSQFEVTYFDKKHTVNLLSGGQINNLDLFASALKEGLNALNISGSSDVTLILPQESLYYFTFNVPANYSSSTLSSYVKDKVKAELGPESDDFTYDALVGDSDGEQSVMCYAIKKESIATFNEAFKLLNVKLVKLLPESLCLFTLFEKTLRAQKKENILYASVEGEQVSGYVFSPAGLSSRKKWITNLSKDSPLEKVLKDKAKEAESEGTTLARIILSGPDSESIRQDTFTKAVGVWTNPLKRIIPHFYQEYLKVLITTPDTSFPILTYDACFGAFVFTSENKKFNILKNSSVQSGGGFRFSLPHFPGKALGVVLIFVVSFVVSFLALMGISRAGLLSFGQSTGAEKKITTTPSASSTAHKPSSTPTPSFKKEELRIKVLNGSGTAGQASKMKDLLIEKGYQEVLTGNADTFDYETTVIQAKKSAKAAVETVKADIKEEVPSPKVESLSDDEASDIVIIIGADFK